MLSLFFIIAKTKIAIIGGTGSVGSYFALKLVRCAQSDDYEVSIIGNPHSPHLKKIQKEGLRLTTSEGEKILLPKYFYYIGPFSRRLKKQDIIIVSVKQPYNNLKLAKQIRHMAFPSTTIGFIANGLPFYFLKGLNTQKLSIEAVDPHGNILNTLKEYSIINIQPFIAARISGRGQVTITRPLDKVSVTLSAFSGDVNPLLKALDKADIKTVVTRSGHKDILEKLQFALAVNTLSALEERTIGDIFDDPEKQDFIKYVITLLEKISIALGVGSLRTYEIFKAVPITKGHYSSLHHDIKNRKPSEINAIVSATIELAQYLEIEPLDQLYKLKMALLRKACFV